MLNDEYIENPFAEFDEQADRVVPHGTMQIYQFIADELMRRDDTNVLRGSAATMCVRRRWYQAHGTPGKPLTPRKILNFASGDITEKVLQYYVERACVGEGKLYKQVYFGKELGKTIVQRMEIPIYEQIESSFKIKTKTQEHEIFCHFDGLAQRHDGSVELLEFKSAADFGFKSFQDEGAGDYLKQVNTYMMTGACATRNVDRVRFFYFRKSTGHIWDRLHFRDENLQAEIRKEFLVSISDEIPERPYGFNSKGKLDWQCGYCPYIGACHGEHKIEWKRDRFGNFKPNYVFD